MEFLRFHIPGPLFPFQLCSCKPVANMAICFRLYSGNNDYIIIWPENIKLAVESCNDVIVPPSATFYLLFMGEPCIYFVFMVNLLELMFVFYKVLMQGKFFQRCTHFLYCSVLSLGEKIYTRRMSDMVSISAKIIYEILWS